MRVMVDTNVLFSALLFPDGQAAKAFAVCIGEHELVLSSYVIEELKRVLAKKRPSSLKDFDLFLESVAFTYVYTPENPQKGLFSIRDEKDYPVLYAAIAENVDILLTGDADFKAVSVEHPEILTPSEFLERY